MRNSRWFLIGWLSVSAGFAQQYSSYVNFETATVHPIALAPDNRTLAVCNLPDYRIELFDVSSGMPRLMAEIPVGMDPVSVRWRSNNELWVANYISRTINIVDVGRRLVVHTLNTLDGPSDIAFAGSPQRAFVSCDRENAVQVFDPITRQAITNVSIDGERPKTMATSPDGRKLYVAIFESGNGSTLLVGAGTNAMSVVKHPDGPYGGQYPPPNDGLDHRPPLNPSIVGREDFPDSIIVKKNAAGRWMDDNQGDWTGFVSGPHAALSGRIPGWDLPDRDLAVIDTSTLEISYVTGLMNLCMDVGVNPASGRISVIGTDGTNERRFEPNLKGTFLRVNIALIEPLSQARTIRDLNPHLDYLASSAPQEVRDRSIGDPRGIVWNSAGTRGYVIGLGSRNLIVIDNDGQRVTQQPVELSEGPAGLVLDEGRQRLYVLNRFSANLGVVDTGTLGVISNVAFFDPTPASIKTGRKHLYDTRRNSGLGQVSCASCHPDARFDRLAWDLGDPRGEPGSAPGSGFPFNPMKGPMVTLTLQDIIVPEEFTAMMPLHWRGDRADIESFNITFTDLLAKDAQLTTNEMQEFKAFLSTIHVAASRFRNLDDSMPTNLPLPGLYGVNSEGIPNRTPLPNGNAIEGQNRFFNDSFDGRFALTTGRCATCHNFSSGRGLEGDFLHVEREPNRFFRPSQLRSLSEKLGMDRSSTNSRAGFGFRFDGRSDTLTSLLADVFRVTNNQAIADVTAFLLTIPGSGIGTDYTRDDNQGVHAAVGRQLTVTSSEAHPLLTALLEILIGNESPAFALTVRGTKEGLHRGWVFNGEVFQSDRNAEQDSLSGLLALATPATPLTFTTVPQEAGRRMGIDRDDDGIFDQTEIDNGFDPANYYSRPANHSPRFDPGPYFLSIHPGMTVQGTLTAQDPDFPTQFLTFTLEPGAPSGAQIDPVTGDFAWTPNLEQGDVAYQIRVRVTDDGLPPLVDVKSLSIWVQKLRVFDVNMENNGESRVIIIKSTASAGRHYQLQSRERLDDSMWTNVGDQLTAISSWIQVFDPSPPGNTQRFYRVVLLD